MPSQIFSISLGTYNRPKRNLKQYLCKMLGCKLREMLKWSMNNRITSHQRETIFMSGVCYIINVSSYIRFSCRRKAVLQLKWNFDFLNINFSNLSLFLFHQSDTAILPPTSGTSRFFKPLFVSFGGLRKRDSTVFIQ